MKTKEELNALKNEVEAMNKKLAQLNDDEMKQVVGGTGVGSGEYDKRMQGDSGEENTGKSEEAFR